MTSKVERTYPVPKFKIFIGQIFGKLKVIDNNYHLIEGRSHVKCVCECGNEKMARLNSLQQGNVNSCGCLSKTQFKDLTGQKFNKLQILQYVEKDKSNNHTYLCKCDCGTEKIFQGSDVKMGKVKSCGCGKYEKAHEQAKRDNTTLIKDMYAGYRNKAKKRPKEFSISLEDFTELTKQNCHYCGIEPSHMKKKGRSNYAKFMFLNGIDRVDNNKGYTIDNCVPCCKYCNQAKHTQDVNYFKSWIERVYNHLKAKGEL